MKKLNIIVLLLVSSLGFSQVEKNVGDFNSIAVFDRISVELIKSTESKIEIKGDRANEVELVNKNGNLKVRMKLKKLLDGESVTAKVYYKSLESIDASEGSYVAGDAIFKQASIKLNAKEGSEIRLNIDVQKAELRAVTGGTLNIKGTATNQDASVGTGGILRAEGLETSQTTVTITTGGEADVRATELVDAKVRAGGTITVFGSPKQINKKTTLGGSINESKR
ncbi:head GIN domain-containing protein [Flavobacterium sp. PLA-1-15]|uniref:head GIN domain-containing protein n=1 Tax=Flavobacterium sp. PLA-1-15 TaxID=3380533 RepID=UPI003B7C29EF